jgi:hypothetical protein
MADDPVDKGNTLVQETMDEINAKFSKWGTDLEPMARRLCEGIRTADPNDDKSTPQREIIYAGVGFVKFLWTTYAMNLTAAQVREMISEVVTDE